MYISMRLRLHLATAKWMIYGVPRNLTCLEVQTITRVYLGNHHHTGWKSKSNQTRFVRFFCIHFIRSFWRKLPGRLPGWVIQMCGIFPKEGFL